MPQFKLYKLGDLIDIQNGYAFKSEDLKTTGIPIIKIKNIQPPNIAFNEADYYPHELNERLKQFLAKKKDILISMTGSHVSQIASAVGKVGRYGFDKPALINQRVGKLYSKDINKLNNDYLYYFISRPEIQFELATNAGGSANQANISPQDIKELEIDLPDIKSQTLIASILSSLDDKIELNRRTNQTLEQIAQTLFKKYFVDDIDPDNLPEGWRWGVLSDVIEFSNGNAFSSKDLLDNNNGDCYHVFKMGHIKKGGGLNSLGTKSYFKKIKAKGLEKYILRSGDLLMCMTDMKDSMALLGHTALMNENDKYIVNQRVGLLRAKNNLNIDYPFLYLLSNSKEFIEDLRSRANSGVQVNLSTSEIKNSKIIIPEKSVNKKFNEIVVPLYEKIFSMTKENEKLIAIRDSLLPKIMSGEIEVNGIE